MPTSCAGVDLVRSAASAETDPVRGLRRVLTFCTYSTHRQRFPTSSATQDQPRCHLRSAATSAPTCRASIVGQPPSQRWHLASALRHSAGVLWHSASHQRHPTSSAPGLVQRNTTRTRMPAGPALSKSTKLVGLPPKSDGSFASQSPHPKLGVTS